MCNIMMSSEINNINEICINYLQHPKYYLEKREPYDQSYTIYDFALLKLENPANLSRTIGIVCLPQGKSKHFSHITFLSDTYFKFYFESNVTYHS